MGHVADVDQHLIFVQRSSQSAQYTDPMLVQCFPIACDAGLTLNQHRFSVSCLPGFSLGSSGDRACLANMAIVSEHVFRASEAVSVKNETSYPPPAELVLVLLHS